MTNKGFKRISVFDGRILIPCVILLKPFAPHNAGCIFPLVVFFFANTVRLLDFRPGSGR